MRQRRTLQLQRRRGRTLPRELMPRLTRSRMRLLRRSPPLRLPRWIQLSRRRNSMPMMQHWHLPELRQKLPRMLRLPRLLRLKLRCKHSRRRRRRTRPPALLLVPLRWRRRQLRRRHRRRLRHGLTGRHLPTPQLLRAPRRRPEPRLVLPPTRNSTRLPELSPTRCWRSTTEPKRWRKQKLQLPQRRWPQPRLRLQRRPRRKPVGGRAYSLRPRRGGKCLIRPIRFHHR